MELKTAHYKELWDRQAAIECLVNVENLYTERKKIDLRKKVRKEAKSDTQYDMFIDLMTKFEPKWNGHLGRISMAKHRIKLALNDTCSVHCALYRAGSRAQDVESL